MTAPISGSHMYSIQSQQAASEKQDTQEVVTQQKVQNMEEALTMLKADLTELSDESVNFGALMKSDGGKKANDADSVHQQSIKKAEDAEHLDQAAQAAAMTDEVDADKKLRRKKEKEKKLEDKLAMIKGFIQDISLESLPEELKEAMKELESNFDRIEQQKGRLKQLDSQLEHYANLLAQAEKDS